MPPDPATDELDPSDPHRLPTSEKDIYQTITIATEGMHSEESAREVESVLRGCDGVKEAKANAKEARVSVTFDPRVTHGPALHDAVLKAGYRPSPITPADDLSRPEQL